MHHAPGGRPAVYLALALAGTLGPGPAGALPAPVSIEPVASSAWTGLTNGATFGPSVAAFDANIPGTSKDADGVTIFHEPDVIAPLIARDKTSLVEDLIVVVALAPGTQLSAIRLTLTDSAGNPLASASPNLALLTPADAVDWGSTGLPFPLPGLESNEPFRLDEGAVLGAHIRFQPPLRVEPPPLDATLARIRFEFSNIRTGAVRVFFAGVADALIAYTSSNSGSAYYRPPDPTPTAATTWGALKSLWR